MSDDPRDGPTLPDILAALDPSGAIVAANATRGSIPVDEQTIDFGAGWSAKTAARRTGCQVHNLLVGVTEVADRCPDGRLVRTRGGNLSIVDGGSAVGYLNLTSGRVVWERS